MRNRIHLTRWMALVAATVFAVPTAMVAQNNSREADPAQPANRTEAASREQDLRQTLREDLQARLPRFGSEIEVSLQDGVVTLAGQVANVQQRFRAQEAAEGTRGVREVVNNIRVEPELRRDEQIVEDVRWALDVDPGTTRLETNVGVKEGVVTLRGTVDTWPQKRLAEWVASGIRGVRDVNNQIQVAETDRPDNEIRRELQAHFQNNAVFDGDVAVAVRDGVVTLTGTVDHRLEKTWAMADAWVRGVKRVNADGVEIRESAGTSQAQRFAQPRTDEDIREAVKTAFVYDPRIFSFRPEVEVNDGVVRLTGTVSNLKAKRAAEQVAQHTTGVRRVENELQVEAREPRTEEELARLLRRSYEGSAFLNAGEIDVTVNDSEVTLEGTVESQFDRWNAEDTAARVAGIADVENNLKVKEQNTAVIDYHYYPTADSSAPGFTKQRRWGRRKATSSCSAMCGGSWCGILSRMRRRSRRRPTTAR